MRKSLFAAALLLLGTVSSATMVDDPFYVSFTMDRLEIRPESGHPVAWESMLRAGKDLDKLYIESEGETQGGDTESENQLLYSRAVSPFWDLQLGAGYDRSGDQEQFWGILALQGLAPYFFETKLDLLVGSGGTLGIRFETEYEALLTQKLILRPRIDADLYSDDIEKMGLGSGLSSLNLGLRLRYEFVREFAPYIGAEWEKTFGNTAKYRDIDDLRLLAGLRFWF
jgi:copper resistance protein B